MIVHWGAATAAIDVDSHAAGRRGVEHVGEVSGNEVADNHVSVHVIRGRAKGRADVGVESDTSEFVTRQRVVDDHVIRGAAGANPIGKKPTPEPPICTPLPVETFSATVLW
jgi:hypothetical protein